MGSLGEWIGGAFALIVIAALIVMCSGVFPRRNQNWTTVFIVAAGIPAFLVAIVGAVGVVIG